VRRSFFLAQLEQRGIHLAEGPQAWLPHQLRITPVIRKLEADNVPREDLVRARAETAPTLTPTTTLAEALTLFQSSGTSFLAVTASNSPDAPPRLIGSVHHVDVLRTLNRALEEKAAEEHG
jgi:CIC family chloride channel protein